MCGMCQTAFMLFERQSNLYTHYVPAADENNYWCSPTLFTQQFYTTAFYPVTSQAVTACDAVKQVPDSVALHQPPLVLS